MTAALYMRPILCKYCDSLFDFPTFTSDIKEKDVPIRTRICCGCLVKMREDENLQISRQARSVSKSSNRSRHRDDDQRKTESAIDDDSEHERNTRTSSLESNDAVLSLRPATSFYSNNEPMSARTSTETTATHGSFKQDHDTIIQSNVRAVGIPTITRRTTSDIHSILN